MFVNHYSNFTYVHLMTKLDTEATVESKLEFEKILICIESNKFTIIQIMVYLTPRSLKNHITQQNRLSAYVELMIIIKI